MRLLILLGLLASLLASTSAAEVVDVDPAGFTSRSVHDFAAAADEVWQALTNDINQWWHPDHTFSGDAQNLFLDARAGQMFGEKLPGGGSVLHMEVLQADPGKLLRLRGGLGPLQAMAVVGVLSVEFAALGEGTRLTVTYVVGGYADGGLAAIAGPVEGVVVEQFQRLRGFLSP